MRVAKNTPKRTSALSSSDLKRLEEAFFSIPKEKAPPVKKKLPLFVPVLALTGLLLVGLFYLKYTVLIVPKIAVVEDNLLSSQMLRSVSFSQERSQAQFSQGVLYLSLDPKMPQAVTLNVKTPIDLEKNDLFLHLSFVDPTVQPRDLTGTVVVKDTRFFSNARNPEVIAIDDRFIRNEKNNYFIIPVKGEDPGAVQMNFAQIIQVRLGFLNLKDKPVSLLIREIKLGKEEDG